MEKLSNEDRVAELQRRLRVVFPDQALALSALTHKSYGNEHGTAHNERLEFLGDAVVDLAISDRLMERFPTASEGELSQLRALIVNEDGLAKVARACGLGDLLLLGKGEERTGGRSKSSVLADALEAVLGAIYLAGGLAQVLELVDRLFADSLEGVASGRNGFDYKTRLQVEMQTRMKAAPRYRVISESGPDHEKVFEVEAFIGDEVYARATGRSKKEAEQAAAQKALERLSTSDTPR